MARKIKVDNSVLKRLKRKKEKERIEFRKKRKFILILCEGTKTEPNYFKAKKRGLPPNVLETVEIDIQGTGANTISVVDLAQKEIEHAFRVRNKKFDSVWVVIDRDSFPARNFNGAIFKCRGKGFNCAWSNEAFELWYVLHFQYRDTPMSREDYKQVLQKEINKRAIELRIPNWQEFTYQKNAVGFYNLLSLLGNEEFAIKNAEKLRAAFLDERFANHNPCTTVDELVKEINELVEEE